LKISKTFLYSKSEWILTVFEDFLHIDSRSPDFNPIEPVWDMVGRRVKVRTPAPADLRDLSAAVIQEWQEIDQAVIQDLFEGMPRRMEAVIQPRGGNIR
jgi:hypothetical protein